MPGTDPEADDDCDSEYQSSGLSDAPPVGVALGSDPSATLAETIAEITTRPVVFFDVFEYFALPEDTIRFSVNAYDIDADIISYEWDVDLDGTIDATPATPSQRGASTRR